MTCGAGQLAVRLPVLGRPDVDDDGAGRGRGGEVARLDTRRDASAGVFEHRADP